MKDDKAGASRRNFLKLAAAGAPAVAVAAVTGGKAEAAVADAVPGEGLRRTEHVAKYMASARF